MMKVFDKYKYGSFYKKLLLACFLFYTSSIAIKLTYSVQLVEIIRDFGVKKADAAMGLTIYYVIYAIAQVILALFIQRINIGKFFLITTILSAASFSLIGVSSELWELWLILGLNGIFQSACWGGVNFILGKYFPEDTLSFCSKFLATGTAVGNSITFAISGAFVAVSSWKYTFVFFAAFLVLAIANMLYWQKKTEKALENKDEYVFEREEKNHSSYIVPEGTVFNIRLLLLFLLTMGFITHLIFYGIGNWIPNLLFEVYHLPTSYSLLISLVMPLITVPASLFIMTVYDKTNQIARTAVISGVLLTIAFAAMCFTYSANIIYAILMSIIIKFLTQCFCSVSFAYVLMKFKHFINIGSSTLTINALASIGAGVAPFVTGLVMDNYGWKEFYIMLTIITAFTTVVAIIGYIVIKKRKNISDYM